MNERGAVSILAVAVVGVVVMSGTLAMAVFSAVGAATRAQVAADAAALAAAPVTFAAFGAAGAPEDEAAAFAAANGARLIECRCTPDPVWRARTVTVVVAMDIGWLPLGLDRVEAAASARFDPTVWLATPRNG